MAFRLTARSKTALALGVAAAVIAARVALAVLHHPSEHPAAPSAHTAGNSGLPSGAGAATVQRGPGKTQPDHAAPPASDSPGIEVCGLGRLPVDPKDLIAVGERIDASSRLAEERWYQALRNSDDYRARAAGLFLVSRTMRWRAIKPDPAALAASGGEPDPVTNDQRAAFERAANEARDELVQLAAGAQDPAVYALAIYACDGPIPSPDGACPGISYRGWARIDADNGLPWLVLSGEASKRHDASAEADAFGRASSASKFTGYGDSIFAFGESQIPMDTTPLQRWSLGISVIGFEAATPFPAYSIASRHCTEEAMHAANVRAQCNALAELMVGKGKNLIDVALGAALGKRVGWPQARIDALHEEQHAFMAAMAPNIKSFENQWTCDEVNRTNAWVHQRSQLGELAAARDAVAQSGATIAELAKQWQERMDQIAHEAARRASDEESTRTP